MDTHHKPQSHWGRPLAFVECALSVVLPGLLVTYGTRALGRDLALASMALLGVGSVVLLWRTWRHRGEGRVYLGQVAALPAWLRRWVLGEGDDTPRR